MARTLSKQDFVKRSRGYAFTRPQATKTLRVSETLRVLRPSQQFGNLFNAYAKAINRAYQRSGSLFQHPFDRVRVRSDGHFQHLMAYIHQNPQKHGLVDDFREWPYSSYHPCLSSKPTRLQRHEVLAWFEGTAGFRTGHEQVVGEQEVAPLVPDDFDGLGT
jgi:putative transposase